VKSPVKMAQVSSHHFFGTIDPALLLSAIFGCSFEPASTTFPALQAFEPGLSAYPSKLASHALIDLSYVRDLSSFEINSFLYMWSLNGAL